MVVSTVAGLAAHPGAVRTHRCADWAGEPHPFSAGRISGRFRAHRLRRGWSGDGEETQGRTGGGCG